MEISQVGPDTGFVPAGSRAGRVGLPTGADFWVRFSITNEDIGTMTDLDLSVGGLGDNLCPLSANLRPSRTRECVVGPFEAESGNRNLPIVIDLNGTRGLRQGASPAERIVPPLDTRPPFRPGHQYSLVFYFQSAAASGVSVLGSTNESPASFPIALSGPVHVDCSDRFAGGFSDRGGAPAPGDPPVLAYVIRVFDSDGSVIDDCTRIPRHEVPFFPVGDDTIFYRGE